MVDTKCQRTFVVNELVNLMPVLCLMVMRIIDNGLIMGMLVYAVVCLMLIPAMM